MVNGILGWVHTLPLLGWMPPTLEQIFGVVFAPVAWVMGVPWKDASTIGDLLGTRLVLNEFVAFLKLGPMKATLDPRSFTIATYALCGFANFSSIAMQIGGIGALAPNRKSDLARLGLRAVAAGSHGELHVGVHRRNDAVIDEAIRFIEGHTRPPAGRLRCRARQRPGRVCGELAERVDIPYGEIPGWPASTAVGHAGKLIARHAAGSGVCGDGGTRASCTKAIRRRRSLTACACWARSA